MEAGVEEVDAKYVNEEQVEPTRTSVPEGYKLTEVGVIPDDWPVVPLGELVEIASGESPSKFLFVSHGIPYFKVEQLNRGLVFADETEYRIAESKIIKSGSIIFPKRGASILLNKIRILRHDSFMDTNLMTLTCKGDLSHLFLFYILCYKGLDSVADTTSIPQINNKHIVPYLIPLPRRMEQTAIANALSDVDALINSLENLIAKKQAIKTATMQQLLTGRTRLPQFATHADGRPKGMKQSELGEIPEDWEVKKLREISPSQSVGLVVNPSSYFVPDGVVPMLVGSHIRENAIDWSTAHRISEESNQQLPASRLRTGDLVTVRVGEPGITAVVPPELDGCNCASMMIVRRHSSFDSRWLCSMLNSHFGRSQIEHVQYGTAQKCFNIGDAVNFTFPAPSLEEQTAIANAMCDVDALISRLRTQLAKTVIIKTAMMQQLLTGRTRLL